MRGIKLSTCFTYEINANGDDSMTSILSLALVPPRTVVLPPRSFVRSPFLENRTVQPDREPSGCGNQEGFFHNLVDSSFLLGAALPFLLPLPVSFSFFRSRDSSHGIVEPSPCPIAIRWSVLNRPLPNCRGVHMYPKYMVRM